MIGVFLALLGCTVVGAVVARALHLRVERAAFLGVSMLLGLAVPAFVLFVFSMIRIRWSALSLVMGTLLIGIAAVAAHRKVQMHDTVADAVAGSRSISVAAMIIDTLTLLSLAGYAWYATIGPPPEADFIATWGAKGRIFAETGAIDWQFLQRAGEYAHPDYPILLPLIFAFLSLISGSWDAAALGLLFPFLSGAVLLIVRSEILRSTGSRLIAALGTLASVAAALSPYVGIAEGPLISYGSAGVLVIRRGLADGDKRNVAVGSILLGLAGSIKNEGLTLVAAVLLATLVFQRVDFRRAAMLWPAVVIPIPWIVLRHLHQLESDLTQGSVSARIWSQLQDPGRLLDLINRYPVGKPVFWIGISIGMLLILRYALRFERFLLITLLIQYAFFLLAYLATPHDLEWHFRWSWERVINQQTLLLEFLVISGLATILSRAWPPGSRPGPSASGAACSEGGG